MPSRFILRLRGLLEIGSLRLEFLDARYSACLARRAVGPPVRRSVRGEHTVCQAPARRWYQPVVARWSALPGLWHRAEHSSSGTASDWPGFGGSAAPTSRSAMAC